MSGVRIQHPDERDVLFTLVDGSRPYRAPITCLMCGATHAFKTYHFRLDGSGAAIVSHEIVERLKRLPLQGGFAITNEVANPPKQTVSTGGTLIRPTIVAHPDLKEPT